MIYSSIHFSFDSGRQFKATDSLHNGEIFDKKQYGDVR